MVDPGSEQIQPVLLDAKWVPEVPFKLPPFLARPRQDVDQLRLPQSKSLSTAQSGWVWLIFERIWLDASAENIREPSDF